MPDKLDGISGCSIWKMNALGFPRESWTIDRARIVAVQTGEYKKRVVKGTVWPVVATLMRQAFPDLEPSFNLLLPRPPGVRL
jgi:hypothetical protein